MSGHPPWVGDESALVIIDWSWWLNKAFALFAVEGMTAAIVGWLTQVLAHNPAHLAIALDDPGETWRHKLQHPTDPDWRYKGKRPPKPEDFWTLGERCTQLAELHSIPVMWAQKYEADDVIATATSKARAAGYRVYICSADKDLHALCEATRSGGNVVLVWDNFSNETRGPAETEVKFHVRPNQIADYLAIAGDGVDAVPGVPSLGGEKAAWLLGQFVTLEAALDRPAFADEQYAALDETIKSLAKRIKKASVDAAIDYVAQRDKLMQARRVARWHETLLANAEVARFSRDLTALACDAPIAMQWEALPVGGFQVEALRNRYLSMGYTAKAREVPSFPKRAPWCIPYAA